MRNIFLSLLTVICISVSGQSKALVGLTANDDGIALLGLAFMDISQVVIVDRRTVYRSRSSRITYSAFRVITYVPLALFGLFVLDENNNEQIGDISLKIQAKYNLTLNEVEKLNEQKDQVNYMLQDVASLIKMADSRQSKYKISQKFWQENQTTLHPYAFSALKKIAKGPIGEK